MARQLGASDAVNLQAIPLTVMRTMPTPIKIKFYVNKSTQQLLEGENFDILCIFFRKINGKLFRIIEMAKN